MRGSGPRGRNPRPPDEARPRVLALLLAALLSGCGGSGTGPSPAGEDLPPQPVPLSPVGGAQVATDMPTFVARNARGYDHGQAEYAFHVLTASGSRELAAFAVPAGRGTTSGSPRGPLPRGMSLSWRVTARGPAGEVSSGPAAFRPPSVACLPTRDPYAKSVVDWYVPACSLARNIYNDPSEVLGPPNAGGFGPDHYFGFLSLGEGGYVTVDMEGCAADGPGADVRVFQAVGSEPVTLYASGSPAGPFVLLDYRRRCGERLPGSSDRTIRFCDFDLASGEVQEARYFKVEDGELFPCQDAETPSEGADIDAVEILNSRP